MANRIWIANDATYTYRYGIDQMAQLQTAQFLANLILQRRSIGCLLTKRFKLEQLNCALHKWSTRT